MGCATSCMADESTFSCPLGACSVKHCICKGKVKEEEQPDDPKKKELDVKTPEQQAEIASRVEYALWMKEQRNEGKAVGILHPKDKKED